jgi:predicted nucleic-acid-binding Zn-ribbon protein
MWLLGENMKSGTCPKCGSNEILADLRVRGGEGHPMYVGIVEPEPANRPFIWSPKNEQSQFTAHVCGACGYTEYYAVNFHALNEGRKKGFKSS